MWTPCEDRLQRQFYEFLSNDDALSHVRRDYFGTATFYEKLLLHSKHLCRGATSPEKLVRHNSYFLGTVCQKRNFFRTVTFPEVLLLETAIFSEKQ